jgi:hypothetical protein
MPELRKFSIRGKITSTKNKIIEYFLYKNDSKSENILDFFMDMGSLDYHYVINGYEFYCRFDRAYDLESDDDDDEPTEQGLRPLRPPTEEQETQDKRYNCHIIYDWDLYDYSKLDTLRPEMLTIKDILTIDQELNDFIDGFHNFDSNDFILK